MIGAVLAHRYRIDAPLGGGSRNSDVFEATDIRSRKKLILRLSAAETLVDLEAGVLTATDGVELFKRQTQMLAGMSHASLASIEDWGTESIAGTLYVFTVLESYSGGTLRQILDRGRRLTPSQALVAGLDVCRALHFIHGKGWVHGDVRPANIFIGDDGRVRLAGLGLKRMVIAEKMSIEQANYAAPEIAAGEQPSAQSDVYSLATTLLESITGALPFSGETAAITLSNRWTREATTPIRCGFVAIRPATKSKITKNHSINFAASSLDSVPTETTFASARLSACDSDIAPALFMIMAVSSTTVTPSANSMVEPSGVEPMNCTL